RLRGRRQALALSRRRRVARIDVPSRAGRHWSQLVSVARVEEPALSGAYGQRTKDVEELARGEDRRGRESAACVRRRCLTHGRVHLHSQSEKIEIEIARTKWPLWT